MKYHSAFRAVRPIFLGFMGAICLALIGPTSSRAQSQSGGQGSHARHQTGSADESKALFDQIEGLRAQVEKLQAAVQQKSSEKKMSSPSNTKMAVPTGMERSIEGMGMPVSGKGGMNSTSSGAGSSMPGMGMMGKTGGMKDDMGEMESMSSTPAGSAPMPGMRMMDRMSGPKMSRMKGMGGMQMSSGLPGFPGASHLYHVGATDFFLDHPQHITLTPDQQMALNRIKERALLNQATSDRKIEEAEQELWTLTAADTPDATKLEVKVREIEKLRGDERLAFIRAVGEAAKVLTDEQRAALLGAKQTGASH